MAEAFFGKGYFKKESVGNRLGVVALVYFLLLPLQTVMLSISLLNSFSYIKVLVLACLLVLAAYSLTTLSNRSTTTKKS